jgi:hypothetical protein
MSVAVVSSVYGGYDSIRNPVPQTVDCEFIMVTAEPVDSPPWRNVVEPRPRVHPRLASRIAKCNPWLYTDADVTIWVDADIEINSPNFVQWCLDSLGDNVVCQWKQPDTDINEELRVTRHFRKWDGDPIEQQVALYNSEGYPEGRNTYWCGLIVRSKDFPQEFGDEWLAEMVRWSCQDQIAYAHLTYKYGIEPALLPMAEYEQVCFFNVAGNGVPLGWRYEHYIRWVHSVAS